MTLTFDLEIGMRVASKVANLHSEFGHGRPLGSRVIRYVHDGRMDGRADKSKPYCPLPTGRDIIIIIINVGDGRASGSIELWVIER